MARTQIEVRHFDLSGIPGRGVACHVDAGDRGTERIVPPAGETYAFTRKRWARRVEVYVSPTGRSVRVYVDGREVKKP
jgi:hypothetical protein